jgi:hypothetical protein
MEISKEDIPVWDVKVADDEHEYHILTALRLCKGVI